MNKAIPFIAALLLTATGNAQSVRKDLDSVIWNLNLEEVVITAKKVERASDTSSTSSTAGRSTLTTTCPSMHPCLLPTVS